MEDLLDRLSEEYDQLSNRINKLSDFIDWDEEFNKLSDLQRVLLVTQLNAMDMYHNILETRIYDIQQQSN